MFIRAPIEFEYSSTGLFGGLTDLMILYHKLHDGLRHMDIPCVKPKSQSVLWVQCGQREVQCRLDANTCKGGIVYQLVL